MTYATYQEKGGQFPGIGTEAFRRAVHLVEPDGTVYRGAAAAFRTLQLGDRWGFLLDWYRRIPFFRKINDRAYRWIARHRPLMMQVTKLLWGKRPDRPRPFWLWWLGVVVVAFFALWAVLF